MKFDSGQNSVESAKNSLKRGLQKSAVLLCGSLLLSSIQTAQAAGNDRPSIREFRNQREDLTRREARKQFRDMFGRAGRSVGGASLPNVPRIEKTISQAASRQSNKIERRDRRYFAKEADSAKLVRNSVQDLGARTVRLSSGIDLDLSSSERNIVLGAGLFKNVSSVDITVGGDTQNYGAGSKVTASEYVAVKQALSDSGQKIVIDGAGIATGGTVDLSEITANNDRMRASSLTISSGVTTYGDFGRQSDFRLKGDLNNFGSLYAVSSNESVRSGAIRAGDITNNEGALISSVNPGAVQSFDLELNARGNLSNYGDIISSGDLTLVAGNSIENKGTLSANNSVNLNTSILKNSNTIEAFSGNINIDGPSTAALHIDNTGGVLAAVNGAINVRTPDYTGSYNNYVKGGDLLSKEVNLHAGTATNYVHVNQLTGILSQTGLAGHVIASTENLIIGDTCLTGDPTYFNETGSITVNGTVEVEENLTIVAARNILGLGSLLARDSTQGFDITLIAGANIVATSGGSDTTTIPPLPGSPGGATLDGTVFSSGANGGGSLILNNLTISTTPTNSLSNGSAGNLYIFAFHDSVNDSGGVVNFSNNVSINTSGVGTGANGNVLIVAGAPIGNTIAVGNINASGGAGGGGNLTMITAQPESSGGNVVYDANGTRTSAAELVASGTLAGGNVIIFGGVATAGGDVLVQAGNNIAQGAGGRLFTDNIDANVVLEAGGNIGSGFFNPFVIEGFNQLLTKKVLKKVQPDPGDGTLTANAGGQVDIVRNASTNLTLMQSSATNGFALRTNSLLNVAGHVTSTNGLVRLENSGGNLRIEDGVQITALTVIDITNGTIKKLKPKFTLGVNSQLSTTAVASPGIGDIFLTLDNKAFEINSIGFAGTTKRNAPPPTYAGKIIDFPNFPNITTSENSGGSIMGVGKQNTVVAFPPENLITANGAVVQIFAVGKKGSFIFEGDVAITAGQ